uniref:SAM-dependent MTase RsmB/NOP-type domain-containing protein n=1 Tax=Setaria digitata TaxID=48799 RepID=A0A915PMH0_9BILA
MPDLYSEAGKVVQKALNKQSSIRNAVYTSNFRNKKQLLRLCCETLRLRNYLDRIMEIKELDNLLKKFHFDRYLLYVLLYEYIFGQGLHKAKKTYSNAILKRSAYIDQQLETMKDIIEEAKGNTSQPSRIIGNPRYARVNTLKWSLDDALQALEDEGWNISSLEPQEDDGWYTAVVSSMSKDQLFVDCHVDNLLLFPAHADLHQHWMVTDGYLLLQDKASCLSSQVLNPKGKTCIFDICAAPGMKTTHLAALVQNEGKIWAIDKVSDRVKTLFAMVEKAGATNVNACCGDFLRTDVTDRRFNNVRYALLDPPCSGSGIVKRMDELIDGDEPVSASRLQSLSNLQAMLLKHAMKLPNLKKIVYSTCSIHEEENEQVVEEILNDNVLRTRFKLVKAMPKWPHRGKTNYSFGSKCLRALPEIDLTNGFIQPIIFRLLPESWKATFDAVLYPTCPISAAPAEHATSTITDKASIVHDQDAQLVKDCSSCSGDSKKEN